MKKWTKMVWMAMAVISGLTLLGGPLFACSSLGPEKHMGIVTFVNPEKGTMSLIDAESQKAMAFVGESDVLNKINVNDTIVVTFEEQKTGLVAKAVVVHRAAKSAL